LLQVAKLNQEFCFWRCSRRCAERWRRHQNHAHSGRKYGLGDEEVGV